MAVTRINMLVDTFAPGLLASKGRLLIDYTITVLILSRRENSSKMMITFAHSCVCLLAMFALLLQEFRANLVNLPFELLPCLSDVVVMWTLRQRRLSVRSI